MIKITVFGRWVCTFSKCCAIRPFTELKRSLTVVAEACFGLRTKVFEAQNSWEKRKNKIKPPFKQSNSDDIFRTLRKHLCGCKRERPCLCLRLARELSCLGSSRVAATFVWSTCAFFFCSEERSETSLKHVLAINDYFHYLDRIGFYQA